MSAWEAGAKEGRARTNGQGINMAALSPRMVTCLEWASRGKSSVDIGALIGISPRTVDEHITEARRRLGVRTRVQAIVMAFNLGLLRLRD